MSEQTRIDLEKAFEENRFIVCIQLYAEVKSPYDDYIHQTNPCIAESLRKMGWI
jgi:hypothetical protein